MTDATLYVISLTTYKTFMKAGEKRHSMTVKEICLSSQSPSSHLIRTKQEEEVCSGMSGENSVAKRRAQVFSPLTVLKCDNVLS